MSKKRTLADLMDNDFFIDFDTQPKRIKLNESANKNEEPDNAVVDCKVNKVIAHCEDEKPVDCLGKKKPLEKPLTEEARSINELNEGGQTPEAKAWQDANCYKWNAYAVINGKRKSVACTYEPKEINPDTLIASVRRIAAHKLNLIMSECYFLKKPFTWDGNLEITRVEFGAEPEYITTLQIKRQGDRDLSQIPEL